MDLFQLNACIGHPFNVQLFRIPCAENKATVHARSEVLETVLKEIRGFWNVKPYRLVNMGFLNCDAAKMLVKANRATLVLL
jgi:hypothetical protein